MNDFTSIITQTNPNPAYWHQLSQAHKNCVDVLVALRCAADLSRDCAELRTVTELVHYQLSALTIKLDELHKLEPKR